MDQARRAATLWRETFYPYQIQWITEPSRFALYVKSRQIGFSHATAGACVKGALFEGRPQIVLSASQGLSDEVLDKARRHAMFLARAGYPGADKFTTNNATEIAWSNSGRIIALPASPRTARSFSGDVWLDEFAYHLDPEGIRDAAFPIALRGDWRIRVFSTPNGARGLFYELFKKPAPGWVARRVTLDDAIREGVPIDRAAAYAIANNNERLIRQWYRGEFLEDAEGALWTRAIIDVSPETAPELRRVVVAVDPSVAADGGGDECGIVVAGVDFEGHLWVIRDATANMSPSQWAARVVALAEDHRVDAIVAEANNGGALVEQTLRAAGASGRVRLVHAARGKRSRAEPVSALYEQGKAHHLPGLSRLEDELCTWSASSGDPSPNRLDALVWAAFELCEIERAPRVLREFQHDF
jgi:phage terminase large subunit-like protein